MPASESGDQPMLILLLRRGCLAINGVNIPSPLDQSWPTFRVHQISGEAQRSGGSTVDQSNRHDNIKHKHHGQRACTRTFENGHHLAHVSGGWLMMVGKSSQLGRLTVKIFVSNLVHDHTASALSLSRE